MEQTLISTTNLALLGGGTLKNGQPYQAVLLTVAQAGIIAALHNATITELGPDEKSFVLPKDENYFRAHLEKGSGNTVISLVSNGMLIAQAMVRHPTKNDPLDGMVDLHLLHKRRLEIPAPGHLKRFWQKIAESSFFNEFLKPEDETLLQAVSVAPAYRGQHLMNILIGHWLDHAQAWKRTEALSEVDIRNKASWSSFLKGGLGLESIGTDPVDGTLVYNIHANVGTAQKARSKGANGLADLFSVKTHGVECAADDVEAQRKLFKDSICVAFNRASGSMSFVQAISHAAYAHGPI